MVKADNIRIKHEYKQKEVKDNYGRISAYINGNYMKSMIYSNSIWLGEYKTKERALEVLDEIQKLLMPRYLISNITKEEGMKLQDNLSFGTNMIQTNDSSSIEQINGTLVFQMPEE